MLLGCPLEVPHQRSRNGLLIDCPSMLPHGGTKALVPIGVDTFRPQGAPTDGTMPERGQLPMASPGQSKSPW
jgi:hypothetical protein